MQDCQLVAGAMTSNSNFARPRNRPTSGAFVGHIGHNLGPGSVRTEHSHDVVHPHRNQRCPVTCHPSQADKSAPGGGIRSSGSHPDSPLQAGCQPHRNRRRARFGSPAVPPGTRAQGSQVNDLPGQIHNSKEQIQAEKNFPTPECIHSQVEVCTGNRVSREDESPAQFLEEVEL